MSNIAALRKSRNVLHEGAAEVAQQLHDAEMAFDHAISHIAILTGSMIRLRQDAGLSAVIGQDPLSSVGEAMNTVIRGRAAMVDVHHKLAATGIQLRIDPMSYGSLGEKG